MFELEQIAQHGHPVFFIFGVGKMNGNGIFHHQYLRQHQTQAQVLLEAPKIQTLTPTGPEQVLLEAPKIQTLTPTGFSPHQKDCSKQCSSQPKLS